MLVERDSIPPMALPEQVAPCPEIGGDVLVRGMGMPELLHFDAERRRSLVPLDGESPEQTAERSAGELIPVALHLCVLAADGKPVFSPESWSAFAGRHPGRVADLWAVVASLSGLDDAPKNA